MCVRGASVPPCVLQPVVVQEDEVAIPELLCPVGDVIRQDVRVQVDALVLGLPLVVWLSLLVDAHGCTCACARIRFTPPLRLT